MVSTHADLLRKLTVVLPIKMPSTAYGVGDFIIVPATGCHCAQFWTAPKYITFLRTILFNPTSCTAKSPNLSTPFRFSVYIFRKKVTSRHVVLMSRPLHLPLDHPTFCKELILCYPRYVISPTSCTAASPLSKVQILSSVCFYQNILNLLYSSKVTELFTNPLNIIWRCQLVSTPLPCTLSQPPYLDDY
jgi:hypothetical protein